MNNKGQSLVLFILTLPILLGIMVLIIDLGNAIYTKNKINNIIEIVIEYGLENNYEEEELKKLINYNLKTDNYQVEIKDEIINIKVEAEINGIISNIIDINSFKILSEYKGYMENNKKVIKKVK